MSLKRCINLPLLVLCLVFSGAAQHANDTLLFTIRLKEDSTDLFRCRWGGAVQQTLAGPVLMADKTLLFYSEHGYALYNHSGKLLDIYSLFRQNRHYRRRNEPTYKIAFPIDKNTVAVYRESSKSGDAPEILHKKIRKGPARRVNSATFDLYKEIGQTQLFNLSSAAITDEMARKSFLQPHLVGYTRLEGGTRWWSLDKFYLFTSPLIMEHEGNYVSFFPGLGKDQPCDVKKTLIEPHGVFSMDSIMYYYGVYTPSGSKQERYFQKLYLCDQAGNLLYSNTLMKSTTVDAVLGENEEEKMLYTVKRAGRRSFLPAVAKNGDIYYAVIDYEEKKIDVYKRLFYRFVRVPSGPALLDEIDHERGFFYEMSTFKCDSSGSEKVVLPKVNYVDTNGTSRMAKRKDLRIQGYLAKIVRRSRNRRAAKLKRIHSALPERVQSIQDSLSYLSTAACPYSISLENEKNGRLRFFDYGLGDVVISARVIQVTNTFEVFVRVDLVNWAEVVVFNLDGEFVNRFIFNRENYEVRNDVVAVSKDRRIVEKDYEVGEGAYRYFEWKLTTELSP